MAEKETWDSVHIAAEHSTNRGGSKKTRIAPIQPKAQVTEPLKGQPSASTQKIKSVFWFVCLFFFFSFFCVLCFLKKGSKKLSRLNLSYKSQTHSLERSHGGASHTRCSSAGSERAEGGGRYTGPEEESCLWKTDKQKDQGRRLCRFSCPHSPHAKGTRRRPGTHSKGSGSDKICYLTTGNPVSN